MAAALGVVLLGPAPAQAAEVDIRPDVTVYGRVGASSQGHYWSTDPASNPGGLYRGSYRAFDLWSRSPGSGFTMLYRVNRPNGKYALSTDPAGEGLGSTTPLGYIAVSEAAAEAVLASCRLTGPLSRYYVEGRLNWGTGTVSPIDFHGVVRPGGRTPTFGGGVLVDYEFDNPLGYVERIDRNFCFYSYR